MPPSSIDIDRVACFG